MVPLPAHGAFGANLSSAEREFWEQPNGEGFRPCLDFGIGYRKASGEIVKERRRFLVVVASGGLNQQRNQIVDAVVIARILEAALVVPVLQVNLIWGDDRFVISAFSYRIWMWILDHFLANVLVLVNACFTRKLKKLGYIPFCCEFDDLRLFWFMIHACFTRKSSFCFFPEEA